MSDHVVQSDHDSDGTAKESLHFHQSAWMSHWMHSSCKPKSQGLDMLSRGCPYREDRNSKQLGPEIPPKISKSAKSTREFSESRIDAVNAMNESLKLVSDKFSKGRSESQSFTKFILSQNRDTVMAPRNVTTRNGVVYEMGTSSGGGHFQREGIPGNLEQQVKSPAESLHQKSSAVSPSFQHDVGSSSKIVPHRYDSGKSPVHSFIWQQEELNQPSQLVTSKEHWKNTKFQSYSESLVDEKKISHSLDFRRFGTAPSRQNNMPLLLHDPSVSNNQLPVVVGKQCENLQNRHGSLPDVDTMRICTTVDSMGQLSGHPSKFSQMTHHFMITKETGINLLEGREMFRDSTFSTNIKGKMLNEFLSLSPGFGFRVQHGVKLQPLESSTDGKGIEDFGDVKTSTVCLQNESSAETDTMDMDVFQKDHFSCVVSSPITEITKGAQVSSTSQAVLAPSTEETSGRLPNTELPDINEELPAVLAVASSADDRETITSRTQSLDVDHLLSDAEPPTHSKSIAFPGGHIELDPSIRWVKRLKLSASDTYAHSTKNSKMEEASSHEKVNESFSKIVKCCMTSSEPTIGKCPGLGKEAMDLDQNAGLLRNDESFSTEYVRKTQDVTPLNPWIRRWCHQRDVSTKKNNEFLVCQPQSSNASLAELRKKHFPSIAAMALMGKALNSFQPFEFRKRGTYVVWNT
ncbi:hypothetical protein AB3S75_043176 [Citrus x aurantiifolia]